MIVNRINSNLIFRQVNTITGPNTNTDIKSENILALKDINTSVKFERHGEGPKTAEPVEKSFMSKLKDRLYKTYIKLADTENRTENSEIYLSVLS